jgi:hypothetical protein
MDAEVRKAAEEKPLEDSSRGRRPAKLGQASPSHERRSLGSGGYRSGVILSPEGLNFPWQLQTPRELMVASAGASAGADDSSVDTLGPGASGDLGGGPSNQKRTETTAGAAAGTVPAPIPGSQFNHALANTVHAEAVRCVDVLDQKAFRVASGHVLYAVGEEEIARLLLERLFSASERAQASGQQVRSMTC